MRRTYLLSIAILSSLLSISGRAADELSLASPFSDHAVLQRDVQIPVWGKAPPNQKVVVRFAGQEKTAMSDSSGKWLVKLDPLSASSEGRALSVASDSSAVAQSIADVLVGEVWLASGQSNMNFALSRADGGEAVIAAAKDGQLRLFAAVAKSVDSPADTIGGKWAVDSPDSARGFSAVAYFFGQELRRKLGVPVGIIRSSVGGTVAEAWTAREALQSNPTLVSILTTHEKNIANFEKTLENYRQREPELLRQFQENRAKAKLAGTPAPRRPQAPAPPSASNNRPSGLYNGSIAPLQPYAIRGAIWYQGEANSARGQEYQTLFPAMIASWRKAWGQGDFPFLFAQIAPHNRMTPEVREAQRITAQTTQSTAMAATVDVGNPSDIHPTNKRPVGERLALAARAVAYGERIEYSGPEYESMRVDGHKAILSFTHIGGGLVAKGDALKGFSIAGADRQFVDARAEIQGETVVVSADSVAKPVAVRYGWTNVPEVNLWNKADLPASPFQTDGVLELEPGFESLLTGHDLTGWHYKDGPEFARMKNASDGRYTGRDHKIVVNPGKGLAQLWTTREFGSNFHLKLEFRAGVNADSGIFIRQPQLQCRDYLVAGPYKELKKYKPQDWNEIEVIVQGDKATCTCNGEPLEFTRPLPATGPIGLEADRGQMEYRRIRIKSLP